MKYFFLLILILFSNSGFTSSLFETSFYDVEFISDNIEDKKLITINKLKQKSILDIFEKTLQQKHFNRLSNSLSEDLINTFIKNIIINNEKIINNKYQSKIKINYEKKKIINFYREKKIPYIEYNPKKILLIILAEDKLSHNLFTKNNKYYSYYIEAFSKNNNIFEIPNLDINDRFLLNKEDIIFKKKNKILNFSKKYNVNNIVTLIIKKNNKEISYDLVLYSEGKILEKKLELDNYELNEFFINLEKETIDLWKNINQIQNNFINVINCKINYFNMLELKEIRDNLKNISIIKNVNTKSLTYKSIIYKIDYFGNKKILSKISEINKLKINNIENNCTIRLK